MKSHPTSSLILVPSTLVSLVLVSLFIWFWNVQVATNQKQIISFIDASGARDIAESNYIKLGETLTSLHDAGLIECATIRDQGSVYSEIPASSNCAEPHAPIRTYFILKILPFVKIPSSFKYSTSTNSTFEILIHPRMHTVLAASLSSLFFLTSLSILSLFLSLWYAWRSIQRREVKIIENLLRSLPESSTARSAPTWIQSRYPNLTEAWKNALEHLKVLTQKSLLAEKDQALLNLAKQVSHDLRSPLAALKGYRTIKDADPQLLDRAITRVEEISSSLLVQHSQKDKSFRPLWELVTELSQEFQSREIIIKKKVSIKLSALPNIKDVMVAETVVYRILQNLIENAAQAFLNTSNPEIIISQGDGITKLLEVTDNGPGIPTQIKDKIFKASVSHGKLDGHGLGLMIVKELAAELNCSIVCDSHPGQTRFTLIPQNK